MDVTDLKEELLLLRKENAELRRTASAEKAALERRIDELCAEVEQGKAENERLRELVDYMTPIALYAASEQERDRMRELGVEVDG